MHIRFYQERHEEELKNETLLRQKLNGILEKHNAYSLLQDVKKVLRGGKLIELYKSGGINIRPTGIAAVALVFWRDISIDRKGMNISGEETSYTEKFSGVDGIFIAASSNIINPYNDHIALSLYSGIFFREGRVRTSLEGIKDNCNKEGILPELKFSLDGASDSVGLKEALAKDIFQRQKSGRVPKRSFKNGNLFLP